MKKSILALSVGTFALGIAEFVIMGILGDLTSGFGISDAQAGHIISAYALGVSIGAPGLLLVRKYRLKTILMMLTAIIAAGNLLTAVSPTYTTILCARFISGLPHGAYFGVGAIVARQLADEGKKTRAVSIMVAGMTVATIIGVPLGTFLSTTLTWRFTFAIVAASGFIAFLMIRRFVPATDPLPTVSFKGQFRFLRQPAPWLIFAGVFFGQTGIYCWYSYVEPMMENVSGFSPSAMTWIMALAGSGMFIGNLTSGYLADRSNAAYVSGLISALSIGTMILIYILAPCKWAIVPLTVLGTAGLFGIGGPLQSLIIKYSRGGEMLGAAGIQISFNVGNAIAAAIGGMAISSGWGYSSTALCGIPLLIVGATSLAFLYRRYEREK